MSSRDEYVAVMKQAFITLGKKAAMDFLVSQAPFLGRGLGLALVNPILAHVLVMALTGVTTGTETAGFFLFIDMRGSNQGKAFERSAYANYEAQRNGTPQDDCRAPTNLKRDLRALVVFTN